MSKGLVYALTSIFNNAGFKFKTNQIRVLKEIEEASNCLYDFLCSLNINITKTNSYENAVFLITKDHEFLIEGIDHGEFTLQDISTKRITKSHQEQLEIDYYIVLNKLSNNELEYLNYNFYFNEFYKFLVKKKLLIFVMFLINTVIAVLSFVNKILIQMIFDLYMPYKNEYMIIKSLMVIFIFILGSLFILNMERKIWEKAKDIKIGHKVCFLPDHFYLIIFLLTSLLENIVSAYSINSKVASSLCFNNIAQFIGFITIFYICNYIKGNRNKLSYIILHLLKNLIYICICFNCFIFIYYLFILQIHDTFTIGVMLIGMYQLIINLMYWIFLYVSIKHIHKQRDYMERKIFYSKSGMRGPLL